MGDLAQPKTAPSRFKNSQIIFSANHERRRGSERQQGRNAATLNRNHATDNQTAHNQTTATRKPDWHAANPKNADRQACPRRQPLARQFNPPFQFKSAVRPVSQWRHGQPGSRSAGAVALPR